MLTTVISLGVAGVLLMFIEMFVPGIIAGVIGGILLFASVFIAYRDLGTATGNVVLLAAISVTTGLWWWWATKFQHTRFGRSMTLLTSSTGEAGTGDQLAALADQVGTAVTPLRPSGTVIVTGQRVDATTAGEFIEAGTQIRVVRAKGLSILVRKEA